MLGTGYFAMQYRERALEVAERELNNSALLLSRHFDQQLSDLQHVHEDVVSQLRADGVHTADEFERKMSTLSAHEMLRTKLAVLPHVGALIGLNVADTPSFQRALAVDGNISRRFTSERLTEDKVGAVKSLVHFPILIVATTRTETALADWRAQTKLQFFAAALAVLIVI